METRISVSNISTLREETYLCPSSVKYVKPVRAINSKGQWRIVLNHLEAKDQFISQTIRVETCNEAGQACPKVPGKAHVIILWTDYSMSQLHPPAQPDYL